MSYQKIVDRLPIDQQIEIAKEELELANFSSKHYSSNPLKLSEVKFKIQTNAHRDHINAKNSKLAKLLKKQGK